MSNPRVSVVMPVYNRAKYISSAIDSILIQTHKDFELIIVDDGSTDNTVEIIKGYGDPRIYLIQHEVNKGVAAARNTGYRNARGEFIVVTDSDDINRNDKLQIQVEFLEKNTGIDIVGCVYRPFNDSGNLDDWIVYEEDSLIRAEMLFWPGTQTASMFRREKLIQYNSLFHNENFKAAVDYEWFNKIPKEIQFANIKEPLYLYRWHYDQISTRQTNIQTEYVWKLRRGNLIKLGIKSSEIDYNSHNILAGFYKYEINHLLIIADFKKIIQWCEKIIETNKITNVYIEESLIQVINDKLNALFAFLEKQGFDRWVFWHKYKYNNLDRPKLSPEFLKSINGKNIAILGTKEMGLTIYSLLLEEGYGVKYFVDNHCNRDISIDNTKIVNDSNLIEDSPDILIISIVGSHRHSIQNKYKTHFEFEVLTVDELFKE